MGSSSWSLFAPVIATVLGWAVVNHQNDRREARKEYRSLIDSVKKQVVDVSDKAVSYLKDEDSQLSVDIKWALDVMEIEVSRIPGYAAMNSKIQAAYVAFTEACTGGKFEQADRSAVAADSYEVNMVILSRNALIQELETWFTKKYCGIFETEFD